jgi:hypothetical protein
VLGPGDTVSSKIGIGDPAAPGGLVGAHDCAIVNRTVGGHALSYVAVVLGGYNTGVDATAFLNTARALDASIQAMHP